MILLLRIFRILWYMNAGDEEAVIDKAVAKWEEETCITFEKHQPEEDIWTQHIHFVDDTGYPNNNYYWRLYYKAMYF